MHRSFHAGLVVPIAGAVPMSHMVTARAQDVQSLCARIGDDDRVRPIPAVVVPEAHPGSGSS
jgi:hypothetical protein